MPSLLDAYTLRDPLGEGGMAQVWSGEHRRWHHVVAVKLLTLQRPEAVAAFGTEVRAAARVDHPSVVRVYDQGVVDATDVARRPGLVEGQPWLVMERAVGTVGQAADWDQARAVLDALLAGLAATHAAGVLHLDVKPNNLLVRPDGSVALADFGIARLRDDGPRGHGSGSLPYMAPERFGIERSLTAAADLYGVGCTAFQLITGWVPFPSPTPPVAARQHAHDPIPELSPRFVVPPGTGAWVRRLLQKRPEDRFDSAEAARQALAALGPVDSVIQLRSAGSLASVPTERTVPVDLTIAQTPIERGTPLEQAELAWPERWPEDLRQRRPEGLGLGLIGLLAVPFVGREAERLALWEQLLAVVQGAGRRVLIRGPRGVGRTRLARRFVELAARCGARVDGDPLRPEGRPVLAWVDDPPATEALWTEPVAAGRLELLTLADQAPASSAERARLAASADLDLWLEPLPIESTRALLADWTGLGPTLVAAVADLAESDLGAAIAVVRAGVAEGTLAAGRAGLEAPDPEALRLPDRVVARWRDAVGELDEGLALAAVLGPSWEAHRIEGAALRELRTRGWVVERDGQVRWVAAGLRLAVAERAADPRALHERCAEIFADDPWRAGIHRLEAGDLAGLDRLFEEVAEIAATGRMSEGARVLRRVEGALRSAGIPESDLSWARLWRTRALLGPTHQGYRAIRALNQRAVASARAHPDDPTWRGLAISALLSDVWLCGVQLLPLQARAALDEVARLEDRSHTSGWWDNHGWTAIALGEYARARDCFERSRDLAIERGHGHYRYVSDASLGVALCKLGAPDAVEYLERAGAAMLEAGYLSAEGDLAVALGEACRHRGDHARAAEHYERALRAAAEGEARADLGFKSGRALLFRATGELDRARRELDACMELLRDEGIGWESVLGLHRAATDALAGAPVSIEAVVQAAAGLLWTGYVDEDLLRSAEILADALGERAPPDLGALVGALGAALARGRTLQG